MLRTWSHEGHATRTWTITPTRKAALPPLHDIPLTLTCLIIRAPDHSLFRTRYCPSWQTTQATSADRASGVTLSAAAGKCTSPCTLTLEKKKKDATQTTGRWGPVHWFDPEPGSLGAARWLDSWQHLLTQRSSFPAQAQRSRLPAQVYKSPLLVQVGLCIVILPATGLLLITVCKSSLTAVTTLFFTLLYVLTSNQNLVL